MNNCMQHFRIKFRRVHILKYKSRMIKRQGRVPTGKKTTIGFFFHSNTSLGDHAELLFFIILYNAENFSAAAFQTPAICSGGVPLFL